VDRWDITGLDSRIFSFHDAKEALQTYFSEEKIKHHGFTEQHFNEMIEDYDSPLYEESFLRETALCFDRLERTETGFVAYVG
jgi:hypothetical protein